MNPDQQARLEADLRRVRDSGYKITGARRAVLTALHQSGDHLTSADVLARVQEIAPTVGRASVFRSLEMLTGLGIVRPTYVKPGTPTYVLLSQEGHHAHIICVHCQRVIELDDCHVESLKDDLEGRYDVRLSGHLLEFYGTCADCRED